MTDPLLASAALDTFHPARRCRVCRCTEERACVHPEHGPCWWVEADLCSHCGEPAIVAGAYDQMQASLLAATTLEQLRGYGAELVLWGERARAALQHAATTPSDSFDV